MYSDLILASLYLPNTLGMLDTNIDCLRHFESNCFERTMQRSPLTPNIYMPLFSSECLRGHFCLFFASE